MRASRALLVDDGRRWLGRRHPQSSEIGTTPDAFTWNDRDRTAPKSRRTLNG